MGLVLSKTQTLLGTCLAIAFGFIIVDLVTRVIMHALKKETEPIAHKV